MRARELGRIACATLLLTAGFVANGCHASDRRYCDDALELICNCASRPCDGADPPEIVQAMRRCDEEDIRPGEHNVHICIVEAGDAFCRMLDGIVRDDGSVCDARCVHCSAPLERECRKLHYESCDLPGAAGTAGAEG